MFKKISFVLCVFAAFASAAVFNVRVETDSLNYRIGQTINWTIKAWASTGDNAGIVSISLDLEETAGESLQLPQISGSEFTDTEYGIAEGFVINYQGALVNSNTKITNMIAAQSLPRTYNIGNDGTEYILCKGSYTVSQLGIHNLTLNILGAQYFVDTSTVQATDFESNEQYDASFGVFHRADINYDGNVDNDDLAILSSEWLATGDGLQADIAPADGDGIVDMNDFALLAEEWLID